MPGILISYIFLFLAVFLSWFSWRWGIIVFSIFLVVTSLVFLHHATDHLMIYL